MPQAPDKQAYYLQQMGLHRWQQRAAATPSLSPSTAAPPSEDADTLWPQLAQQVAACQRCVLHQQRQQAVLGCGNRQAQLMVIGEAPGAEEDSQGEPFVGAAGQLLDRMLQAIDIQRSSVYIANVIKCRPPANRSPQPVEQAACIDYLQRQIALVQPRWLFLLGRVAAHACLNSIQPLAALRQREHRSKLGHIVSLVSYHPAYLLRKPSEKHKAWEDLKRLRRLMDEAPQEH